MNLFRRSFALMLGLALGLMGCTVTPAILPTSTIVESSPSFGPVLSATEGVLASKVPTATDTEAPVPTATLGSTVGTPASTLEPSISPTFDVAQIVKRTAPAPARCPKENPTLKPTSHLMTDSEMILYDEIRVFLDIGGTRQAVVTDYMQVEPRSGDYGIREVDVTGDGVPELLVAGANSLYVFLCREGSYYGMEMLDGTYHFYPPLIWKLVDMNGDGVAEIIARFGDLRYQFVEVYEWDGTHFQLLNGDPWSDDKDCMVLMGDSRVDVTDTNGDGLLELILKQGIPIWDEYVSGVPWRKETRTCAWNGTAFALAAKNNY